MVSSVVPGAAGGVAPQPSDGAGPPSVVGGVAAVVGLSAIAQGFIKNYSNAVGMGSDILVAQANAIDIAGFVLEGGRRVTLLRDWNSDDPATRAFLREARDGACDLFATTLSPDYNRAHADHFHLDVAARGGYRVCR